MKDDKLSWKRIILKLTAVPKMITSTSLEKKQVNFFCQLSFFWHMYIFVIFYIIFFRNMSFIHWIYRERKLTFSCFFLGDKVVHRLTFLIYSVKEILINESPLIYCSLRLIENKEFRENPLKYMLLFKDDTTQSLFSLLDDTFIKNKKIGKFRGVIKYPIFLKKI